MTSYSTPTPGVRSYFSHTAQPKPTIAYFSQSPGGNFAVEKWWFWQGVMNAGLERNINLLYVSGSEFTRDPQAVLYDLIDHRHIDGILAWQSFVSVNATAEEFLEFLSSYENTPVVTVETKVGKYPAVMIDNYFGMRKLIDHLVSVHNYRKIALLDESMWHATYRTSAYEQIMSEYHIYDPALKLTETQLDERIRRFPDQPLGFEFLITTVDGSALRLLEKFRNAGIRVPEDVGINGYNDGKQVRLTRPAITSVSLPFYRMGYQSTSILHDQIQGRPVPSLTYIPLGLSIRQSCGCANQMISRLNDAAPRALPFSAVWAQRGRIIRNMLNASDIHHRTRLRVWINQLLNTFLHTLSEEQTDETFLDAFEEIINEFNGLGEENMDFNHILTAMRNELLPYIEQDNLFRFENLLEKARVITAQKAVQVLEERNQLYLARTQVLREIERANMLGQSFEQFISNLSQVLPRMEIPGFYLMTYDSPENPLGNATLLFAYRNGRQVPLPAGGITFSSRQLLPQSIQDMIDSQIFIIEALHVEEDQVGYLVFETDNTTTESEGMIYSIFSTQIGSALKGIKLRDEIRHAWRLSEERRASAEEANRLKSRFLSLVSHELRNPINLIINNTQLAAEILQEQNGADSTQQEQTARQKTYLERITQSARYLNALIGDVLDLTSTQMGRIKLAKQSVNMNRFIGEIADITEQLAGEKNLSVTTSIDETLPTVMIDPGRMNQVMLNLVSNAVKFTEAGTIHIAAHKDGDFVSILIRDTGIGIPLEEQGLIFNEFQQSARTSSRGFGGMGLGLAISRHIVELHQGSIRVFSSGVEHNGSTFEILLPLDPRTEQSTGVRPLIPDMVWLISRNQTIINNVVRLLGQNQYRVLVLEPVAAELSHIDEQPPNLILLDLQEADDESAAMLQAIKSEPTLSQVPIIFLSAEHQALHTMAPISTLQKPFDRQDITNILSRYITPAPEEEMRHQILLVDDDPHLLATESELIKSRCSGCEILLAHNGVEALDVLKHAVPDLILLDLIMPELDGFGVLRELQRSPALMNIPVIILTGQALTQEDIKLFEKGVLSVLQKGVIDPTTLLDRLEAILKKEVSGQSERRHLVRQAIVFIHENYQNTFSRYELAQLLGVNEDYLTHCFSEELGMPPNKYINRYRIEQAKKMLYEKPNTSITQIAMDAGFSSQAYFSRVFRKETGLTPKEYRGNVR
ncbi:MAG: response regulator [Anaerolineae bacterium]|nr:response regulator [Anaerolineae bacterium]